MPADSEEFLQRLLATFKVEAQEHVGTIFSGLVALEKGGAAEDRNQVIESSFRAAHSLKGAARAVNAADIERVCQNIEGVFSSLKRGESQISPQLLDSLHHSVDAIRGLLAGADSVDSDRNKKATQSIGPALANATSPAEAPAVPYLEPATALEASQRFSDESLKPQTVRVATSRLDALLLQTEELLAAKQAVGQHAKKIRRLRNSLGEWERRWAAVYHEVQAIESSLAASNADRKDLKKLIDFVQWNRGFMETLDEEAESLDKPFERDRRTFGAIVDGLLEDMKKVVMLPFSSLHDVLLKVARDLARDQGKEVTFEMQGGDVEVDRRILEEMKDPLIHLVRNCVDHGIENPVERERQGKSRRGTVTVAINRSNSTRVELRVADDGSGIDLTRLQTAAITSGMITSEEAALLGEDDMLQYIFRSGISTSPTLTHISGRGLGLAIVQENVEKLGGNVSVRSATGLGTMFVIVIPLTLSTFRGVLVSAGQQVFVVPTAHIQSVFRVRLDEIKTVANQQTITRGGQTIALVYLREVLGLAKEGKNSSGADVLVVFVIDFGGQRIAFVVDEVKQEQEILLKNLGKQLLRVRNIAGVTILGAKLVPVLNVVDLMKSAVRQPLVPRAPSAHEKPSAKKSVLVVDDSITSRTLLKNILEANGYAVETAVDGVDGFTKLRAGQFALVVSDVEMPRMTGFDMTARIRREKRLADLPVILVTALASQEDRERGIDVGANAYIVKTSFDQSNLLEAVRRLI